MASLLQALISASEKAANIARSCTYDSDETLLIAEKGEAEANPRFEKDFKTIADVLAQETARREITIFSSELGKHVRGEECAEIGGIAIELKETIDKTAELLCALVPESTARKMSKAAHGDIVGVEDLLPTDLPEIKIEQLGVWIDPIDGTAEFIAGVCGSASEGGGLTCVTVLIGAYDRISGKPVAGVVNQPFFNNNTGRIIWGLSYGSVNKWGGFEINTNQRSNNTVLVSESEKSDIVNKFKAKNWDVKSIPGAGHKLLNVVLGEADAYIVSKGSTFRWDTCGPHAILLAQGGDILDFTSNLSIKYNDSIGLDTQQYCNLGGIIACKKLDILNKIQDIIG